MKIFSSLYKKVIFWAGTKNAKRYLALVSFAESSFSPVPTDIMLAPMVIANPIKAFGYARIAIFFSVFGGIFGYCLGYYAFHPIVEPFLKTCGYEVTYYKILELFNIYGFILLCFVGCIPLPYKLFTISAGMLQYNVFLFIVASLIGRSLRYFLVSSVVKAGGEKMDLYIHKVIDRIGWVVVLILTIIIFSTLTMGCATQTPAKVISIKGVNTKKNYKPKPKQKSNSNWIWPVKGQILSRFVQSSNIKKNGINIAGTEGMPIKAISAGKVVYSGNGLKEYGNLIIIKHDNDFLSVYAHNKRNIVTEGMNVTKGQKIAEMGSTGADKVMLHFEVRKNGVTVDPEGLLPK